MLRNLAIIVGACVLGVVAAVLVQNPQRPNNPVAVDPVVKPEEPRTAATPAEEIRGEGSTSISMSELKEFIGNDQEDADPAGPSDAPEVIADSPTSKTAFARTTVSSGGIASEQRRVEQIRQKSKERQQAAKEKQNARNSRDSVANPVEKSLKKSKISGNHVLVYFTAPWCKPCEKMKKEVLGTPAGQTLTSRVEYCEINVDDHGVLAGQFGVKSLPHMVLLDAQGHLLRTHGYFADVKDFQQWMSK